MKKVLNPLKKILVFALVATLALAMTATLVACGEPKEEKKGLIICTALLSGSLRYADTGNPLWDPLTEQVLSMDAIVNEEGEFDVRFDLMGGAIANLLKNTELIGGLFKTEDGVLDHMTLDSEGNSNPNVIPFTMEDDYCQKYGVLACYEDFYNSLSEEYGEEYEVSVFNYDWRLDIRKNGELLEDYITSKGYDKVVLTAHSMGGNVVANYLARSEENRNKVETFVSFGSPYYGSAMAIDLFENLKYFPSYADDILGSPAGAFLSGMDLKGLIENKVIPMAASWTALYQLMPWPELLSETREEGGFVLKIDGKAVTSADELYTFYESRPWAKDENGNVRKAVKELRDFHDSCYVEVNGEKVFSTSLVDSYYVCGDGLRTISEMDYVNDKYDDWFTDKTGDGTVLIKSSGSLINGEKATFIEDAAHIPLGLFDKYTLAPVQQAIANIQTKPLTLTDIFGKLTK